MIKVNGAKAELRGFPNELLAEVSIVVKSVNEALSETIDEDFARHMIEHAVRAGFMTEEELKAENEKSDKERKELRNDIGDLLGMLADVLRGKEDKEDGSEQ